MTDSRDSLIHSARQLVEIDRMLGGQFAPAERNPLPAPTEVCGLKPPPPEGGGDVVAASGVERNAPCSRTGLHEAPAVGERDATDLAPDYIKTPIIKDVTSQGNAMFKNPDDPSESINVEDFCLRLV